MLIKETVVIERDIFVAPCLNCGSQNVQIFDYGYNAPNHGGGKCLNCGRESSTHVSTNPTIDELANVWNGYNDIQTQIDKEQHKIEMAHSKIKELLLKIPKA